jgi:hypothetical protein
MRPPTHENPSIRFAIGIMVLLLAATLFTPAAWAVESGMLSITAESVTAARAIFAQHPDPKVRNDDHLAMKLVAPEYWHYSLMKPDYETGVLVTKTFRFDTNYYVNARTKHMDALLNQATEDGAVQVVNLGAGYDSRAYRFRDAMPDGPVFRNRSAGHDRREEAPSEECLGSGAGRRGLCAHRFQYPDHSR